LESNTNDEKNNNNDKRDYLASPSSHSGSSHTGNDRPKAQALEVLVDSNVEKAMKVLKRKLIKEGIFKELKARRYYEKPSLRRKRKAKESVKKIRKEAARASKTAFA